MAESFAERIATIAGWQRRKTYFEALGKFMNEFAATETYLLSLLKKRAGVTEAVAKAIFSGVRTEQAISYVRRIAEAESGTRNLDPMLEDALQQFTAINTCRNNAIHQETIMQSEFVGQIRNANRALNPEKAIDSIYSSEFLIALAVDSLKVGAHIMMAIEVTETQENAPSPTYEETFYAVLEQTWLYKRPSLGAVVKLQKTSRKQHSTQSKRQRKSSPV